MAFSSLRQWPALSRARLGRALSAHLRPRSGFALPPDSCAVPQIIYKLSLTLNSQVRHAPVPPPSSRIPTGHRRLSHYAKGNSMIESALGSASQQRSPHASAASFSRQLLHGSIRVVRALLEHGTKCGCSLTKAEMLSHDLRVRLLYYFDRVGL